MEGHMEGHLRWAYARPSIETEFPIGGRAAESFFCVFAINLILGAETVEQFVRQAKALGLPQGKKVETGKTNNKPEKQSTSRKNKQ